MRTILLALATALVFFGCDPKTPATVAPPPVFKLTASETAAADTFGRSVADAIRSGDVAKMATLQDFEAIWSEIVRDLEAPKAVLDGAKRGFLSSTQAGGGFFGAYKGKPVKFIRTHERDGETVILIRLKEDDGTAYSDLYLTRTGSGGFLIRDIYNYAGGERVSAIAKRIIAQAAALESKSPLEKIFGGKKGGFKGSDVEKAFGLANLLKAGKFQQILTESDKLSDAFKKERFVLFMRVQAAMALDDETVYLKVLDELAAAFPNDPSVEFALLDRYYLKKDYKKALEAVERLTGELGNDAFLATMKGGIHKLLNEFDKAEAALKAGIEAEPDESETYLLLVDVLATKKDNAAIQTTLESMYEKTKETIAPVDADEAGLTEFFASPEGKAYTAFLKKNGAL